MRRGPMFLLIALGLLLFFIVGVRYGQRVEKTNKATDATLKLSQKPAPTERPLVFKTYTHKKCGVEFLYPSTVMVRNESSNSAQLVKDKEVLLELSCAASPSAVAKGKVLEKKLNPQTGKSIYFVLDQSIQPLLDSSLKFIK